MQHFPTLLLVRIVSTILLLEEAWVCDGCWKQEREALLNLKPHFPNSETAQSWPKVVTTQNKHGGITAHNRSYSTNTTTTITSSDDCCRWDGVECNVATGRVATLSVRGIYYDLFDLLFCDTGMQAEFCPGSGNSTQFYVNASWFLPFQELRSLDLSGNLLVKWVDGQGPKRKSLNLRNLELLDLSFNCFDNGILQSLGVFPSLKSLSLSGCLMPTKLQVKDLPNVDKLEHLNLDLLPLDSVALGNVGSMTSMRNLSLHGCGLNGTLLDVKGICQLALMKWLDISHNNIKGDLPWCLRNMTSLQWLDLSHNQFTGGAISLSPLSHLMSLEYLKLSDNLFELPVSLSPFLNLSKLKYLEATNIQLYEDQTEAISIHHPTPKFQLLTIILHPNRALMAGGSFPEFLYYQSDLIHVDLANLEMEEGSHNWLMKNNTRLEILMLINTSLSGPLQLPMTPNVHLSYMDFSHNSLTGLIPEEIGVSFPRLSFLNLSGNSFNGPIPASVGNMNSLETLDLSSNRLSGGVPEQLATGCYSLENLILSNNSLQGEMLPYRSSNLESLKGLFLDNNLFHGRIPDSLRNSSNLVVLDLSKNALSGQIPAWMGNLPNLQVMDLSHNKLNESLPIGFSPYSLEHLHLSHNQLQGSLGDALIDCLSLITLDLSHNQLEGEMSSWIGTFGGSLNYLQLSYNKLQGGIPSHFCSFDQLSLIDLSHNNLSGPIFPCLSDHHLIAQAPSPGVMLSAPISPPQEPLQFTTKNNSYSYSGKILESMSGIDLSCNGLTGEIPTKIGNIRNLIALNLSHNDLVGEIPPSMSRLYKVESLDLSYNSLSGRIPPQLTGLYSLESFSVAYNNLSGKVPDQVAQFGTFDSISYQGNPFLCGPPLTKACTSTPSPTSGASVDDERDREGFLDLGAFLITFSASYACVLLGFAAVLGLNPHWRRQWLCFVELSTVGTYYYVVDSFTKLRKLISAG